MEQLKEAVAVAFDKIVASGAIEQAIQSKLQDTVASIIKEQMSTYSDFGKAVKEKVERALEINLGEISLPSYGDLIGKIIRTQIDASMRKEFADALEANLKGLLVPAPAEITLEKLLDDYIEHKKGYGGGMYAGQDFTLVIERKDGGYVWIGIDPEPEESHIRCEIQLGVTARGEVYSLKFSGKDVKDNLFIGPLFNFELALFQMYTAKTKLIIPEDVHPHDYQTRFPYPGEDD